MTTINAFEINTYASLEDLQNKTNVMKDKVLDKRLLMGILKALDSDQWFDIRVTTDYTESVGADLGYRVVGTRRLTADTDLTEITIYELEEPDEEFLFSGDFPSYCLTHRADKSLTDHFWVRTANLYEVMLHPHIFGVAR